MEKRKGKERKKRKGKESCLKKIQEITENVTSSTTQEE